jgi:NAD(P)-dependent dehydrogenase (short-subunit alcohol dehydrogenase family)
VLVNSAAVMHHVAFEDTTPELYDEVLNLNLRSVFFVSQGAAPFLRKARRQDREHG